MSEESKNVLSYIKHHKLGDKIKGFTGGQDTPMWVWFNHLWMSTLSSRGVVGGGLSRELLGDQRSKWDNVCESTLPTWRIAAKERTHTLGSALQTRLKWNKQSIIAGSLFLQAQKSDLSLYFKKLLEVLLSDESWATKDKWCFQPPGQLFWKHLCHHSAFHGHPRGKSPHRGGDEEPSLSEASYSHLSRHG